MISESQSSNGGSRKGNSSGLPSSKRKKASLSSVGTMEAERIVGTEIQEVIWQEFHNISDMIKIDDVKVPRELFEAVFRTIDRTSEGVPFPSEMVYETFKTEHLRQILLEISTQIRAITGLNREEFQTSSETGLVLNGVGGRMDYAMVRFLGLKIWYLLSVEVKTEGSRHALKQMLLYLKRIQYLNPGLQNYYGLCTNVETWQLVILTEGGFKCSTPRQFIYPRMFRPDCPDELDYWIANYSEMITVIYSIARKALAVQPLPVFEVPDEEFKAPNWTRRTIKKQPEPELDLEPDSDLELDWRSEKAIDEAFPKMLKDEHHRIATLYDLNEELPTNLLKSVFEAASQLLRSQKYPSELINNYAKYPVINVLLNRITEYIKSEKSWTLPKDLEVDMTGKPDFQVCRTEKFKSLFLIINVNKEMPRHALKRCMRILTQLKEGDPGRKKYSGFVTNGEWWQLVVLSGENKFECSTPRKLLYPRMRDEKEEDHWIANYSEIVKLIYQILCDELSKGNDPQGAPIL